jgi:hypothetical protein
MKVLFLLDSYQHFLLFVFLIAHLTGAKWNVIENLVCVSFMAKGIWTFSSYNLLTICSSLENCLLNLFVHLLVGLLVLLMFSFVLIRLLVILVFEFLKSLCILVVNLLSDEYLTKIFLHSVGYLVILVIVSFAV